jgi:hypothetical protein
VYLLAASLDLEVLVFARDDALIDGSQALFQHLFERGQMLTNGLIEDGEKVPTRTARKYTLRILSA